MMRVTFPDNAPPIPGDAWIEQRRRNVDTFMRERDLDLGRLTAFMRERVGPGEVLLTSSPVHGLANPTSDLDFIRIQDEPIDGARISTKIFDQGHHLECVSFSSAEISSTMDELTRLAACAPAESVAVLRTWDRRREPRRKQAERTINGITADGRMPYLLGLPALSVLWARNSLQTGLEHIVHLGLAEASGEHRGRLGYAVNAVLHLADSLLSLTGDVYTTRKWYLLRWQRAAMTTTAVDPAVAAAAATLDDLRLRVSSALGGTPTGNLAGAFADLGDQVARAVVGARPAMRVGLRDDAQAHAFLPGARMVLSQSTALLVPGSDEVLAPLDGVLADLTAVDASHAAALLRLVRADLAQVALGYPKEAR